MTSLSDLRQMAAEGEPITMVSAYDFTTARLADRSDVDAILVGDSLGVAMLGYEGTDPVTMDEMVHHTAAVTRGVEDTFVVADLPFGSYNTDSTDAVRNATRLKKEGGANAVKLEGGQEVAATVDAVSSAGISVIGHIGVTPQTEAMSGEASSFQGSTAATAGAIRKDAVAINDAGAAGVVVELVTRETASTVTDAIDGFTLGICAGADCDGQVVTGPDLLGLYDLLPRSVAGFQADFGADIVEHLDDFHTAVRDGRFPTEESCISMSAEEERTFEQR